MTPEEIHFNARNMTLYEFKVWLNEQEGIPATVEQPKISYGTCPWCEVEMTESEVKQGLCNDCYEY